MLPRTQLFVLGIVVSCSAVHAQSPAPAAIDAALDRGVDWLLGAQEVDGSWRGPQPEFYHGMTALAVYTLLECGLSEAHPALRAGLAHMGAWASDVRYARTGEEPLRTYDLGVALMAYAALSESNRPKDLVRALAERLIRTAGNGRRDLGARWGYPNDHPGKDDGWTDLSNTQYALLGLLAAHRMGVSLGSKPFWDTVADDLLAQQGYEGHFSYRSGEKASASMTVAGITGLAICREVLGDRISPALSGRVRAGIDRGYLWLDKHWSVETNLDLRIANQRNDRWLLYYLYGLERIGAFVGRDKVGEHDWYAEGARHIVARQEKNGSFGYGDDDTSFALLFLRRGSRASAIAPRARASEEAANSAAFAIGADPKNPVTMFFRQPGVALSQAFGEGARPSRLIWLLDGKEAKSIALTDRAELLLASGQWIHRFAENGRHAISARLELLGADGGPRDPLVSNALEVVVDDVEMPWHREAIRDAGRSLIRRRALRLTASSGNPKLLADEHHGTSWLPDESDERPWFEIVLPRPERANALELTSSQPYADLVDAFGRPRDVLVTINGRTARIRLEPDPRRKQWFRFPVTSVKSVRVEILTFVPGQRRIRGGFKEVALYLFDADMVLEPDRVAPRTDVILPSGSTHPVMWQFVTEPPGADWMAPPHDASGWARGAAGFGATGALGQRTAWTSRQIWLRTSFDWDGSERGEFRVDIHHDDHAEVYWNGVLAVRAAGYSPGKYRSLPVTPEARASLRKGPNVVAVTCTNTGGPGFIDVGIVRLLPTLD